MADDWGQGDNGWQDSAGGTAVADDMEFDAGKADSEKVGGRGTVDKPGKYHFEIVDVKPEIHTVSDSGQPHTPSVQFTLRVLESVHGQSPAGSVTWHRVYVGEKGGGPPKQACYDAIVDFLVAAGIIAMRKTSAGGTEFVNPRTGNTKFTVNIDMVRCKGEQIIGQMKMEDVKEGGQKTGEKVLRFPFSGGAWRLDAEQVADVPKNRDAVDMWHPPAGGKPEDVKIPAASEPAEPKRRGRPPKAKAEAAPAAVAAQAPTPATVTPAAPAATTQAPVATTAVADDDF